MDLILKNRGFVFRMRGKLCKFVTEHSGFELWAFEDDSYEIFSNHELHWKEISKEEAILCSLHPELIPVIYHGGWIE